MEKRRPVRAQRRDLTRAERHRWSVRLLLAMAALRAEGDAADRPNVGGVEAEHALLEEVYRSARRGFLPRAVLPDLERMLVRLLGPEREGGDGVGRERRGP